LSGAAWQEIRVRSGRDDKGEGGALSEGWFVAEAPEREIFRSSLSTSEGTDLANVVPTRGRVKEWKRDREPAHMAGEGLPGARIDRFREP
jgi:hypothetical protein